MAVFKINKLKLSVIIGTHDWERKEKQEILGDIKYQTDSMEAIETDQLENSVDYESICNTIYDEVTKSEYQLVETLTAHILDLVMSDEGVEVATVIVKKPSAVKHARYISVELSARRTE